MDDATHSKLLPMTRHCRRELIVLGVLFLVGLLLRWYRLELMCFPFDSAMELFRAREWAHSGHLPVTGVMNSLGFRNPPGLTWLLTPVVWWNADPRFAAGWIGLLSLTGLWPLYRLGRSMLGMTAWILPCALYAAMPVFVFQGRAIWPFNLMPALGAWALWGVYLVITDGEEQERRRHGAGLIIATASLALALLLHWCVLVMALIAAVLMAPTVIKGRCSRASLAMVGLIALIAVAAVTPSAWDFATSRNQPRRKSNFENSFEKKMQPPSSLIGRTAESYRRLFTMLSSLEATGGMDEQMEKSTRLPVSVMDLLVFALICMGIYRAVRLLVSCYRKRAPLPMAAVLLLAWAGAPPLIVSLLLRQPAGSYLVMSIPALLLLTCYPPVDEHETRRRVQQVLGAAPAVLGVLAIVVSTAFLIQCIGIADNGLSVNGVYYIPLKGKERVVRQLLDDGVTAELYIHLNGSWFQKPYDYLHEEVLSQLKPARQGDVSRWALIGDTFLLLHRPAQARFIESRATCRIGTVGVILLPNEKTAQAAFREFVLAGK